MPNPATRSAPVPVIVDVDTGLDDALALAFLAQEPAVRLLAVTCVAGNTSVDNAVSNTATVLHALGLASPPPIGRGSSGPLLGQTRPAHGFHGTDGLGGIQLRRTGEHASPPHAIELMRDTILTSPQPVTLLALGPLTNVALLIRCYPDIAARLERIMFMGGTMSVVNLAIPSGGGHMITIANPTNWAPDIDRVTTD
ncbi:nucleoside hydrolase [Luethyella okanaganae]|uniref:Nucleoside hydrolase n=1 Tax=Luethyella okanaganae TaxID=69372 RepID=A0ABW1VEN2_9MICO